jgi:hypothetical protein
MFQIPHAGERGHLMHHGIRAPGGHRLSNGRAIQDVANNTFCAGGAQDCYLFRSAGDADDLMAAAHQ